MRRLRRFAICAAVVLAVLAAGHGRFEPAARADPGLVVGVDDDTLKWSFPGWRFIDAYEELRLSAIRVTLRWRPARRASIGSDGSTSTASPMRQMKGNRVVLSIFGAGRAAPATPEERDAYCSYVVDALRTAPSLHDVVIWNEVNSPRFWRPPGQRRAAAYVALLARCYDLVHQTFPRRFLNVISSTAPRHDPRSFIAELGAAYRASGRTTRIFDTFGHNPYPATNAEPPYCRASRLAHARRGRLRRVDGRAHGRVRRHGAAGAGRGRREPLVPRGRVRDGGAGRPRRPLHGPRARVRGAARRARRRRA